MARRRQTLRIRIPPYRYPRNEWRRAIHAELSKAVTAQAVEYRPEDKLELIVTLYITEDKIGWHDVDNRLKDIMDALQGRAGGPKWERSLRLIVPNDHQIHKVTIEKRTPPPQSHGLGHLIIRKHEETANQGVHRTGNPQRVASR
jgi:Holliday junction resolvase RusA-like endonuclease